MRIFSFRPGLHLKGRKLRGIRGFDGKPFHPPLTDIPVGAYVIAPLLDIVAYLFRTRTWATELHTAAGYVFLVGAIFGLAAAITGLADWLTTQKGTQIRRMANAHASSMILVTLLVQANLFMRFFGDADGPSLTLLVLGVAILGLVTIGGTIGGSLVFDHGFNVVTAKDHPAYHPSEQDVIGPKPAKQTIEVPEAEVSKGDR